MTRGLCAVVDTTMTNMLILFVKCFQDQPVLQPQASREGHNYILVAYLATRVTYISHIYICQICLHSYKDHSCIYAMASIAHIAHIAHKYVGHT